MEPGEKETYRHLYGKTYRHLHGQRHKKFPSDERIADHVEQVVSFFNVDVVFLMLALLFNNMTGERDQADFVQGHDFEMS